MSRVALRVYAGVIISIGVAGASALVAVRAPAAADRGDAASSATSLVVGAVLPEAHEGLYGIRLGAQEAEHAARLFGTTFELHVAQTDGTSAADAAADLLRDHDVDVLIGGADSDEAGALVRFAREHGILFMNVGSPADAVQPACETYSFHILPSSAAKAAAMNAAGRTGGDVEVAVWHPTLARFGAGQVIDRFEDEFGRPMTGSAWAGWMAVKIVFDAVQRAGGTEAALLARHLTASRTAFDGHKGMQLTFRPGSHELRQPLYLVENGDVIAEVPTSRDTGDGTHAELLDAVLGAGGDPCAH